MPQLEIKDEITWANGMGKIVYLRPTFQRYPVDKFVCKFHNVLLFKVQDCHLNN